jgi:hypothetical protein
VHKNHISFKVHSAATAWKNQIIPFQVGGYNKEREKIANVNKNNKRNERLTMLWFKVLHIFDEHGMLSLGCAKSLQLVL